MTIDECYLILNLEKKATPKDVNVARRKLQKFFHPDINQNPDLIETGLKKSQQINEAANTLLEYLETNQFKHKNSPKQENKSQRNYSTDSDYASKRAKEEAQKIREEKEQQKRDQEQREKERKERERVEREEKLRIVREREEKERIKRWRSTIPFIEFGVFFVLAVVLYFIVGIVGCNVRLSQVDRARDGQDIWMWYPLKAYIFEGVIAFVIVFMLGFIITLLTAILFSEKIKTTQIGNRKDASLE